MLSHQKSSDMYKYENRNEYTLSSTIKTQFNQYNQNIKRKKSDEASTLSETERICWSNANHNPTPSPVKATPTTTPPPPTEARFRFGMVWVLQNFSPNQNKTQNIISQNVGGFNLFLLNIQIKISPPICRCFSFKSHLKHKPWSKWEQKRKGPTMKAYQYLIQEKEKQDHKQFMVL